MGKKPNSLETQLNTFGIISAITAIAPGRWHTVKRIICYTCGLVEDQRHAHDAPPDQVRQRFERRGWKTGRHPCCPTCGSSDQPHVQQDEHPIMTTLSQNTPKDVAPNAPMPKLSLLRQVMAALEDHFDSAAGRYHDKNDSIIALELGCSLELVTRTRNEAFGPLRKPQEITDLENKLEALKSEHADLQTLVHDFTGHIQAFETKLAQAQTKLR